MVTDVTNSPNFYVGRSADVGDMLLHGQIVSECCYAHEHKVVGLGQFTTGQFTTGWFTITQMNTRL